MKISVNNLTLYYEQTGNGSPVILLHGNGEDCHIFDKLVDKLRAHYTVYAIDSRNHGRSTQTADFSYLTMANDIVAFVKSLKLEKPSVVGFSDGAIIAVMIALQDKDIFDKLVLLGINLKPSDFKKENLDWLKNEYAKTGDPLLKLMLEEPNIELESLKNVSNKTLVVAAENDLFEDDLFKKIASTMPHASLQIMKGYDHAGYVVEQDVLYPYLKEFLG